MCISKSDRKQLLLLGVLYKRPTSCVCVCLVSPFSVTSSNLQGFLFLFFLCWTNSDHSTNKDWRRRPKPLIHYSRRGAQVVFFSSFLRLPLNLFGRKASSSSSFLPTFLLLLRTLLFPSPAKNNVFRKGASAKRGSRPLMLLCLINIVRTWRHVEKVRGKISAGIHPGNWRYSHGLKYAKYSLLQFLLRFFLEKIPPKGEAWQRTSNLC